MDKPLISVIVPVYNVADYLERCICSIIKQTYTNIQIIVVDDGSTDGSSRLCDELGTQDARVLVIHQENQGAAAARKKGIEHAEGMYTCFVDSDDYISEHMIEKLQSNIGNSDLISSGCYCQKENGEWFERYDRYDDGCYAGKEQLDYIISNLLIYDAQFEDGFLPYLWNKMFKTDILKEEVKSVDTKIVYAEDRDLLFRYIMKCHQIRVLHESFYYYCFRETSVMNLPNLHFMEDLNSLYLSLRNVFEEHRLAYSLMYQLQMFIISRLYTVPTRMGFVPEAKPVRFVFPYAVSGECKRIILYGAGRVGRDYHCQLHRREDYQLVLWVDQSWQSFQEKGFLVDSPDRIHEVEYDQIILAVKDNSIAESMKEKLCAQGVPKERVVWKQPIVISF